MTTKKAKKPKMIPLRKLREQRERLTEEIQVQALESLYGWLDTEGFGGSDTFERLFREKFGGAAGLSGEFGWVPIDIASNRKDGRKWPLWQSTLELNAMRAKSRLAYEDNPYATGLVNGIVNYAISKGYTYKWDIKTPDDPTAATQFRRKLKKDGTLERLTNLAEQAQKWMDLFLEKNNWTSSVNPSPDEAKITGSREVEAAVRLFVDGDTVFRLFNLGGGEIAVRFAEPVLIDNPADADERDGWSFGIRHRVVDLPDGGVFSDEDTIEQICIRPQDASQTEEEIVDAKYIVHLIPRTEASNVKRGTPLLSFGLLDAVNRAYKLQRNASLSAAFRAATAEVWKHIQGTQSGAQSIANAQSLPNSADANGTPQNRFKIKSPAIRDIGPGKEPVTPTAVGYGEYLEVGQGDLRQAGAPVAMPEFMISGDASNNNYASIKEAGAPFFVHNTITQEHFKRAFAAVIRKAISLVIDDGLLPHEILTLLVLKVDIPKDDTRSPLERAQEDQILTQSKLKSNQQCIGERGNDAEETMQEIEEWDNRFGQGQQGGGGGGGLEGLLGGDGGGGGGSPNEQPPNPDENPSQDDSTQESPTEPTPTTEQQSPSDDEWAKRFAWQPGDLDIDGENEVVESLLLEDAHTWQKVPGPHSNRRWVNAKTGEVAYSDVNPGGDNIGTPGQKMLTPKSMQPKGPLASLRPSGTKAPEELDPSERPKPTHDPNGIHEAHAKMYWDVTPDQKEAVHLYQNTPVYNQIQDGLRHREAGGLRKLWSKVSMGAQAKEAVKQLDSLMEKSSLPKGSILHRAMVIPEAGEGLQKLKDMVGKTISDGAYASTSTNPNSIEKFMTRADRIRAEISVPEGGKGISLHPHATGIKSKWANEDEVLLPRGSKFKVESVTKDKDGRWRVKLALQPHPATETVEKAGASIGNSMPFPLHKPAFLSPANISALTPDDDDKAAWADVPLNELYATQKHFDPKKASSIANTPKPDSGDSPVSIVRGRDGKHYIIEGHHRAAAAKLQRKSKIRAKLFIEGVDGKIHPASETQATEADHEPRIEIEDESDLAFLDPLLEIVEWEGVIEFGYDTLLEALTGWSKPDAKGRRYYYKEGKRAKSPGGESVKIDTHDKERADSDIKSKKSKSSQPTESPKQHERVSLAMDKIDHILKNGSSKELHQDLLDHLLTLTLPELKQVRDAKKLKGSAGRKAQQVEKIGERLKGQAPTPEQAKANEFARNLSDVRKKEQARGSPWIYHLLKRLEDRGLGIKHDTPYIDRLKTLRSGEFFGGSEADEQKGKVLDSILNNEFFKHDYGSMSREQLWDLLPHIKFVTPTGTLTGGIKDEATKKAVLASRTGWIPDDAFKKAIIAVPETPSPAPKKAGTLKMLPAVKTPEEKAAKTTPKPATGKVKQAIDRIQTFEKAKGIPWLDILVHGIQDTFSVPKARSAPRQVFDDLRNSLMDPAALPNGLTPYSGPQLDKLLKKLKQDYGTLTQGQLRTLIPHLDYKIGESKSDSERGFLTHDVVGKAFQGLASKRKAG